MVTVYGPWGQKTGPDWTSKHYKLTPLPHHVHAHFDSRTGGNTPPPSHTHWHPFRRNRGGATLSVGISAQQGGPTPSPSHFDVTEGVLPSPLMFWRDREGIAPSPFLFDMMEGVLPSPLAFRRNREGIAHSLFLFEVVERFNPLRLHFDTTGRAQHPPLDFFGCCTLFICVSTRQRDFIPFYFNHEGIAPPRFYIIGTCIYILIYVFGDGPRIHSSGIASYGTITGPHIFMGYKNEFHKWNL